MTVQGQLPTSEETATNDMQKTVRVMNVRARNILWFEDIYWVAICLCLGVVPGSAGNVTSVLVAPC